MLPSARTRTARDATVSPLRRGLAALLTAGLAAGLVTVAAATPAAATAVLAYTSGSFTVPDSGPSNPSPVTVAVPSGNGLVRSLSVTLFGVQHAHPQDMVFDLRSPSGVQVRVGCMGSSGTTFNNSTSCQPLTPFYGTEPAGTWSLFPYDDYGIGDDPNTQYGGFTLTLDTLDAAAPTVTTDPPDVTTTAGTSVTLTSAATGWPDPTVRWQVDTGAGFADIAGATSTSLTVTPAYAESGRRYQAVYTNSEGSATTAGATVTALPRAASVTDQPDDTTVASGSTVQFTSTASADPAPTVRWELAEPGSAVFTTISGATATTVDLGVVNLADSGTQVRAVFTNAAGDTVSDAATLTVALVAPVVSTNPSDPSVASGDPVTLEAAAYSEVPATVQWQVAPPGGPFTDVLGATGTTYTFTAEFLQDQYRYRAVFTNPAGSTPTTEATLTVTPEGPQVTSSPTDVTVEEGDPASFSASATGDPVALVQWQVSADGGTTFTDVVGAQLDTYTIPVTGRTQHLTLYRAVFSNLAGTVTTSPASLEVLYAPEVVAEPVDIVAASGGNATFTADAEGTPSPTVQWQVSTDGGTVFEDVVGAESRTFVLRRLAFADSGTVVRAVFTNAVGDITTQVATVTVTAAAPAVTTDVADQHAVAGSTVTFTAAASGDPVATVQWRVSTDGGATFTDIAGATKPVYTFSAVEADQGNRYVAVFTNVGGSASTRAAVLAVSPAPTGILAVTGAHSTLLSVIASLLVAVGAAAAVTGRRRRTAVA